MSETSQDPNPEGQNFPLLPGEEGLINYVLGSAFALKEASFAAGYDERRELALDTLDVIYAMQDSLTDRRGRQLQLQDPLAWRPNAEQLEVLRTELGPTQRRLRMLRGPAKLLKDETFIETLPGTPLRWNQEEMVDGWADFLLHAERTPEGGKSGAIVSATGTGKTGTIAKGIAMMKHGEAKYDPLRVLVLEPTQDLAVQTVGASGDRGLGRFAPGLDVGLYYQHKKQLNKEVVVMCFASFMRLVEQGKMPFFDAVIVDEAHLALGQKMSDAILEYAKDKILIGATATDEYSPDKTIFEIFEHEIYRMGMVEAIKRGVLAPVRAFLLKAEPIIDPATLPLNPVERKRAIRAARLKVRLDVSIGIIRKEIERGVGVFVKVPPGDETAHAIDYAKTLRDHIVHGDDGASRMRWVNAQPVTGVLKKQSRKRRVEVLKEYDEGNGDVLVSVRLLREGIDLPHTKAFIDEDPGEAMLDKEQWAGRTLRLTVDPFTRKPLEAHLYDFEDSDLGDRQATAIKLLKLKHGEAIGPERSYREEAEASKQRRRARRRPEAVRVEAIDVESLGELAVGHGRGVAALIESGAIPVATATFRDAELDMAAAARELGISVRHLGRLLLQIGHEGEMVKVEDLSTIRELFPRLKVEELPETGWTEAKLVAASIPAVSRVLDLAGTARVNGIYTRTFKGPGGIGRFYSDRQVNAVRKLYGLPPLSADEIRNLTSE